MYILNTNNISVWEVSETKAVRDLVNSYWAQVRYSTLMVTGWLRQRGSRYKTPPNAATIATAAFRRQLGERTRRDAHSSQLRPSLDWDRRLHDTHYDDTSSESRPKIFVAHMSRTVQKSVGLGKCSVVIKTSRRI